MNYGGLYRNTPATPGRTGARRGSQSGLQPDRQQGAADSRHRDFRPDPDPASTASLLILHGQEFHTSYWGHLGLLNLTQHLLLPGYAAYPLTAAASPYPHNAAIADMAHLQHALVGYAHPFDADVDPGQAATADQRAAGRCGAWQGRLLRGGRVLGPQGDQRDLVSPARLWSTDSGRRRHGRDGQLRQPSRSCRYEPRVRARRPVR